MSVCRGVFLGLAVSALSGGMALADGLVCGRGVITEIVASAKATPAINKLAWPRMLISIDQTGFQPGDADPAAKHYNVEIRLDASASYSGARGVSDFRRQTTLLQQLMQSRTAVRLSTNQPVCAVFPDQLTIEACGSDSACNF